jgi:hypothetical protein
MQGRLVSCLAVCLTALPAFVVAQQTPVVAPVPSKMPTPAPVAVLPPPLPAPVAPTAAPAPAPPVAPVDPTPQAPEITVNIGGQEPKSGGLAPLPKVEFDLPAGLIRPATTATIPPAPLIPRPAPPAPPAKLTPAQIAQQIAPNFNVTRDYVRLTQCYGIADFMGAVTRIQASRPGATPQVVNVARSISGLQDAMQPMVLAASTVRGEARFRADYDAVARRGQSELATSRTPNVTMQRRLATLDACRGDVSRWRGGR